MTSSNKKKDKKTFDTKMDDMIVILPQTDAADTEEETPVEDNREEIQKVSSKHEKSRKHGKESESSDEQEQTDLKKAIHEQAREDEMPLSANFTLRKILGGDILTARLIRSQVWLIILIVLFVIIYISNRYSVQKDLLEIDKLNKELKDAKYKALSSSSMLTEKCRESHVLEMLKNNKDSVLKMSDQPPYIISVPEK